MRQNLLKINIMLIADLKSIHSPDILDLEEFSSNQEEIYFLLELGIGIKDKDGEEYFYLEICNAKYIQSIREPMILNKILLIQEYNFKKLEKYIQYKINSISGNSWQEIVEKITSFTEWEFDKYKEN
ncbi:hypothetical protein B9T15_09925 [Wohlfahrtiimonas chitiniclastica]|nr:hypothetical protein B9T14_09895 [Wohlfahrtiimonas chitiniclastica]OYQ83401.1 hypothetical protein B9T15_09925 [Wohlfahrtiimonas chitiniclastica]